MPLDGASGVWPQRPRRGGLEPSVISRALDEAASADAATDAALLDLFVPIAPQAIEGYGAPVAVSVLDHAKLDSRLAAGEERDRGLAATS